MLSLTADNAALNAAHMSFSTAMVGKTACYSVWTECRFSCADMMFGNGTSLLEDLGDGMRLPLPDVSAPGWLEGIERDIPNKESPAGGAPGLFAFM